ncbi:hypothetical protein [Iningainema tapete]|uniref:Prepilin-type N-terminal cleavage/methylation domain-containing protein n=1 Tax=Iningainema tapete BLCC-T55 TaxID=2748662 RepID=A0A8J6XQC4_9CYAN|nr:hypothetical protein [Iningainema tapete]MBD2771463.1 hypothetical protein [Iningainema tapete BLCC-T55]
MITAKHLKLLFNWLLVYSQKGKTLGFTLMELLIAVLIAFLIISALLSLVVDILQVDGRETARNETEQEMQKALDYISKELRDAVYIYDGNCIQSTAQGSAGNPNYCPGLVNYLPTFGAGQTPILAFWKPETISDTQIPTDCTSFTAPKKQECEDLQVKRRTYTLVVYLQSTSNPGNKWQGKSRITRYALRKYDNYNALTLSQGYVDPSEEDGTTFQTWPLKVNYANNTTTDLQGGTKPSTDNSPDVLVDFVDAPDATGVTVPECDSTKNYVPTPKATATTASSNSFFACVKSAVPTTASVTVQSGINQDVVLYLRGNAYGKSGVISDKFRTVLQTQVFVRGVINKIPE